MGEGGPLAVDEARTAQAGSVQRIDQHPRWFFAVYRLSAPLASSVSVPFGATATFPRAGEGQERLESNRVPLTYAAPPGHVRDDACRRTPARR